ncbi:MAG: sigma-54-dependent Fis family transcriptional regulator, partial [Myxococcales bacterium]
RSPARRPAAPGPLAAPAGEQGFGGMLGASAAMRRLYPLCARLAASDVPVIIEGETGTGKEVLAEALHAESARSKGPFVVFDCTTVAPNLIESALFGHEKGAFTGATDARKGVFEQAHGGTLLIDEIGDLALELQPKLLRVLQRSEVCRVGGGRWQKVDVRVLVATRRDLDREVQAGRFRDDLFYRLHVGRIELPPLRDRQGDVPLLARAFWNELGGAKVPFPVETLRGWEDYAWPGNVRELYNTVARRLALGELLPPPSSSSGPVSSSGGDYLDATVAQGLALPVAREQVMRELERRTVARALVDHHGRAADASAALGIARRYFNLLRARHGL